MEEAANPRSARGATLIALAQEDLDLYSIEDLDDRTARLEAEIGRVALARSKKLAGRAAADALFRGNP
jgi:uncharacterized small protein (DUF1192 family)